MSLTVTQSYTYTTTTVNTLTTTVETRTLDEWAWNNVSIGDMGLSSGNIVLKEQDYENPWHVNYLYNTISYSSTETFAQISEKVSRYGGLSLTLDGSKAVLKSDRMYIVVDSCDLGSVQITGYTTVNEYTSCSTSQSNTFSKTADENTKLRELGITDADEEISVDWFDTNENDGCGGQNTIGSFLAELTSYGINASISDGRITLTPQGSHYIEYVRNSAVIAKLGLPTSDSSYSTNITICSKSNKSSNNIQQYITSNNASRATLDSMGYDNEHIMFLSFTHNSNSDPSSTSVSKIFWYKNESLATILQKIRDNGYSASINDSTHTVSLSSNRPYEHYLSNVAQANPLKISPKTTKEIRFTVATGSKKINCSMGGTATAGDIAGGNISFEVTRLYDGQYSQDVSTPNGDYWGNVASNITLTWGANESLADFVSRINNSDDARTYGYSIGYNASTELSPSTAQTEHG